MHSVPSLCYSLYIFLCIYKSLWPTSYQADLNIFCVSTSCTDLFLVVQLNDVSFMRGKDQYKKTEIIPWKIRTTSLRKAIQNKQKNIKKNK